MKPLFEVDSSYHGKGSLQFKWQRDGNHCASCGVNGLVEIFDRHGTQVDEVRVSNNQQSSVLSLDWDADGDVLAILHQGSSSVSLYDLNSRKVVPLETNLKDPRCLAWSKNGPHLAIGAGNGALLIYNKETRRQETVAGKHGGPIVCVTWSATGNTLALGSDDKTISLSSPEGITLDQFNLKSKPIDVKFPSDDSGSWKVAAILKNEAIALCASKESPTILEFQQRYGKVVAYEWISSRVILVGFSTGQVIAVSAKPADLGEEMFSERLHRTSLTGLVASPVSGRAASCGDGTVRVIDTRSWEEVKPDAINLETDQGNLDKLGFTSDGQILTVSTKTGKLAHYLTKMPMVHAHHGMYVAYLSSLREVAVVNALDLQRGVRVSPIRISTSLEPSFVALGTRFVVAGMNNKACFYQFMHDENDVASSPDTMINEHEYLSSVSSIKLNGEYCAALCAGKIYLHKIYAEHQEDEQAHKQVCKIFPEQGVASCVALTNSLLIYGTADGKIIMHNLADYKVIPTAEYLHGACIKQIFPNQLGTRIVFLDESSEGFLYNPIDSQLVEIPDLVPETNNVLWDEMDPMVFVTSDSRDLTTYVYSPLTINGPFVSKVGPLQVDESGDMLTEELTTQLPQDYIAIASFAGVVTCQTTNSQLAKVMLGTHESIHGAEASPDSLQVKFCQSLALRKLEETWKLGVMLGSRPHWLALSSRSMEEMNIEMAIRVWRQLGDAGMVMALDRIKFVEDKHLLAGHIAALFGDYIQAQELFLLSPSPYEALSMRKDLLQWEQALKLAESVAPDEIPDLSVEYAQQLEFKGEYKLSLDIYQKAMAGLEKYDTEEKESKMPQEDHSENPKRKQCIAGIARMTLRAGNIPKGVKLALDIADVTLCKECADILMGLKQFPDAAVLYDKAELFEEAASIYIKSKNFAAAQPLLSKVTSPKLHLEFAKAREAEKDFRTAAVEYEKGKDMDSVVRLYLEHMNHPEKAFSIVRKYQSSHAAEMAARYCQSVNDFRGAIEFLLLAKKSADAFELATSHDKMDVFENVLGGDGTPEEYNNIAKYWETKQSWAKAAEFYSIAGQYHKALKLYLHCGESELEKAIEVVGRARSDMLTHTLIDFLMGETNGVVQNPVHIFRLYMALGNYPQAARTAMVISHQEREAGNYKSAHTTLFETHRELEARKLKVPQTLRMTFILLHSYLLVKKRIKVDDHLGASRLLQRVAKNISKFPAHTVPILTSAVIECQRGGLKNASLEYASILMQPEHRNDLDPKFKRKIESIVRKRGGGELEDVATERSPCPYTGDMIDSYELVCPTTKNQIPFCVVTGKHMVLSDWCFCPNSKMPALYSEYVNYLQNVKTEEEKVDPISGVPVCIAQLVKDDDPKKYLDNFSKSGFDDEVEEGQ